MAQVPRGITVTPFIEGVQVPAALAFAPDGRLFFAEVKRGAVRIADAAGRLQPEPFVELKVATRREQGILGLALDSDFATNHYVYIFFTQARNDAGEPQENRVVRYTERDGLATERTRILDDLPVGICCHNGGRLAFGPDGKLYVTIGDQNTTDKVQNLNRLHGKLLRVNPDGKPPEDNPYPDSPVFALGFRNPWGLAFHPRTGVPYVTENGEEGYDEINRVTAGGNYGNPEVDGMAHDPRFLNPVWDSDRSRLAPTGAAFLTGDGMPEYRGDFFFCAYNNGDLTRMRFGGQHDDQVVQQEVVAKEHCRLDVTNGPDGALYLASFTAIYRFGR
jgi:aldose sugar dehydrogenase